MIPLSASLAPLFVFSLIINEGQSSFLIRQTTRPACGDCRTRVFLKINDETTGGVLSDHDEYKNNNNSRRDFLRDAGIGAVATTSTLVTALNSPLTAAEPPAAVPDQAPVTKLAGSIDLPPMGLGAWSWGDSVFWGYDSKNDEELRKVFNYALDESKTSKTLFDSAELYGFGRSEKLIGDFSRNYPADKIQVATKFAAYPFRTKAKDVVKACEDSIKRLGGRPIDLYQIHFPNAWSNAEYWDGLAMAHDKGLVKAVGVSNYGVDATKACHDALAKRGIQLATNQIQLSLLYTYPTQNGLLKTCDDLGVKVLSYSPLGLGMLTGKYTLDAPPSGPRKVLFEKLKTTQDYDYLLETMRAIGEKHGDKVKPSQVALNWCRAKNTVPIPGARTLSQIGQNYAALDWSLSKAEVEELDGAAARVKTFTTPDALPFPKKDINTGLIMIDS